MSSDMQKLVHLHGSLVCPNSQAILFYFYPAGDCDRIAWPAPEGETKDEWAGKAASALYDANETGDVDLKDGKILLPNGEVFDVHENLGKYEPPSMEGFWY